MNSILLPEGLEIIDEDAFEFCSIKHMTLPKSLKKIHWLNLSSTGSGVLNLEIPDTKIEIDMSGYDGCYEDSYMPPLFLVKGKNLEFEKYARRHKRNIIKGYYIDDSGIIWSIDRNTIIEFPFHWDNEEYHVPQNVTSIFRWAFNQSNVKHIVMQRELKTIGCTSGNDFSRLDSKTDFRYEPDFLIIRESTIEEYEQTPIEKNLNIVYYGKSGKQYTIIEPALGHGSDGSVYRIEEDSRYVVMIYSERRRTDAQHKTLLTMVENPLPITEMIEQQIEWPIDIIYADNFFYGYVMPWIYNEDAVNRLNPQSDYSSDAPISTVNLTDAEQMILDELSKLKEMASEGNKIAEDTNIVVKSLVQFVETDLQTWIATQRPGVDDDVLIEQFSRKAIKYINEHVSASNQKVQEEEKHLRDIFGVTWNKLHPTTQASLVSAGLLWKLCASITKSGFDYSGIIIAATSALESELKRVFYTDFQKYMVETYGNPETQPAEKTYSIWPERLLSKTKAAYENELIKGFSSLPRLADNFTMGTLPYMFYDKNRVQKKLILSRMEEYLKTIVHKDYYGVPLEVFCDPRDDNNFVKQCESIRTLYRNPAGHVDVLSRESAEECYTKVVGVGKVDAFRIAHEVEGLIMVLYSYLK